MMKPDKQRIAIAEACGYRRIKDMAHYWATYGKGHKEQKLFWSEESLPDYLNDLNAMAEAESVIAKSRLKRSQYAHILVNLIGNDHEDTEWFPMIHAKAAQKAEAFLKALNLWATTQPKGPTNE